MQSVSDTLSTSDSVRKRHQLAIEAVQVSGVVAGQLLGGSLEMEAEQPHRGWGRMPQSRQSSASQFRSDLNSVLGVTDGTFTFLIDRREKTSRNHHHGRVVAFGASLKL
jgi:hypothetical protein